MKVFDSGMPEEVYWSSLFDLEAILTWLNPAAGIDPIIEIGCGYGTFTVPIAQ
jgi:tRNA G46 methylase TrmB